jgi:hypothetical protein
VEGSISLIEVGGLEYLGGFGSKHLTRGNVEYRDSGQAVQAGRRRARPRGRGWEECVGADLQAIGISVEDWET